MLGRDGLAIPRKCEESPRVVQEQVLALMVDRPPMGWNRLVQEAVLFGITEDVLDEVLEELKQQRRVARDDTGEWVVQIRVLKDRVRASDDGQRRAHERQLKGSMSCSSWMSGEK